MQGISADYTSFTQNTQALRKAKNESNNHKGITKYLGTNEKFNIPKVREYIKSSGM